MRLLRALGLFVIVFFMTAAVAGEVETRLRGLAAQAGQGDPLLRLGLEPAHGVILTSTRAFRILDASDGRPVWKEEFEGEVRIVAEGGPKGELPSVFRVQIGAFGSEAAARKEMRRIERLVGATGVVHHDPDRGNWRVRMGRASERLALNPLLERLRNEGFRGLWIAEEPAEALSGIRLRLVDDAFNGFVAPSSRLVAVPSRGARIRVGERSYRGVVELRVSPFGTVRPINWVELETYLRGVVPAEMGPEVWPQLEALQAQAVAARTYVWKNLGQFEDEGFDLCASPRCQVYKGFEAEHPLTDRAIRATRGEILVFEGEPINALYTATCGGHTENGGEIFPEHDERYLQGVPCRAEGDAIQTQRAVVSGREPLPALDETGADVSRDWALLSAAGVLLPGDAQPQVTEALDAVRLRRWTTTLAGLAGLSPPRGEASAIASLAEAATRLVTDLGWDERARVLLATEDLPALLRDPALESLPPEQYRALAYLVWVEALAPFTNGGLHAERAASRSRLVPALARIGESYRAFGLRSADVVAVSRDRIRMVVGKSERRVPLGPRPFLFGRVGGRAVARDRLELWPGDRVRYRVDASGAVDFLELQPPVKGTSDDRSAKVYSWEVRKTRRQLEVAVNRRVSVGRLEDLRVLRRGVSGRVVELEVVGSKSSTIVRGFDVRRLLALRESLLVIEIQRGASKRIEAVVFAGKGWGHGVGLCQVGAYGMALRGSRYREILSHYYRGTQIETLGRSAP